MPELQIRTANGGTVESVRPGTWRLTMPQGSGGEYRWAQLDDHLGLPRSEFPWRPPLRLSLEARVSHKDIPGTWGFGFWNDPFSASWGVSGAARRIPALPQAAWYFHASPPNYLSLRNDLPAQGFLMDTFSSTRLPAPLLLLGAPALPLLAIRPTAWWLRRMARNFIKDDARRVELDPTDWHEYLLEYFGLWVSFRVDNQVQYQTGIAPKGRLGLILWIDNQFAALPPDGGVKFGTLETKEAHWLELRNIRVSAR